MRKVPKMRSPLATCAFFVLLLNVIAIKGRVNGESQAVGNVLLGPVNDPPLQVITTSAPPTSSPLPGNLKKYCQGPRGQFVGRYCNSFVNCWDGNAVEQFCGVGLMFDARGYCDYPYHVDCRGKPVMNLALISNGWPTDGSYVPPVPEATRGPPAAPPYRPSLAPITQTQSPHQSTAQTSTRPPSSSTIRPQPAPSSSYPLITTRSPLPHQLRQYCLTPRGQFASPNCHRFVNCWDGVVVEQDCPGGLNFNPLRGFCDFPYNYPCAPRGNVKEY